MSRTASTTDTVEHKVTDTLAKGMSKIREFELEVHIRVKRYQRKIAALSVAILVAILGVGFLAMSGYNAFLEITTPALAALYTGLALFAVCGLFIFGATHPKVIGYKLRKPLKA